MEENREQFVMPETFSIWEGHMDALRKKVTRIQNKCRRYGNEFSFEEIGEEFKEVPTNEVNPITGKTIYVKCRFIIVKASGTAVINGWEFVASVEHTKAGNIFSKALTDVEIPVRYRTTPCICEHCNTKRIRKNTFIVRNTESGEFKQIGNSCLCDYTHGMDASMASWFASIRTIFKDAEDEAIGSDGFIGRSHRYYDTREVLQYAAETIRHFGYVKSDSYSDAECTKTRVNEFLLFNKGYTMFWDEKEKVRVRNLMEKVGFDHNSAEAVKMTDAALKWITEQNETNDYIHNLKVVTSLETTTAFRIGLLVSLFPTYNRELEREAKRKEEAESGKLSKYVGEVGERIDVNVSMVKCLTSWESNFGYYPTLTFIWKIVDVDGNVYTWKTSKGMDETLPPARIKGTVKGHKEYNGVLQTELTRCKIEQ